MIFIIFRSFLSKGKHSRTPADPPKENTFPLYESVLKSQLYLINYRLSKNQSTFISFMDRDTPSGSSPGEQISIQFKGHMLLLAQPAPGKINISFEELTSDYRHELRNFQLQKINFKTVLAGIRGTHPQIISAELDQVENGQYWLSVIVKYEFLPEVREVLKLEKKAIPKEESDMAAVRNLKTYLRGMKEQIGVLGNLQLQSGQLEEEDTEIYVPLAHKHTVFTLSLALNNLSATMLRTQMSYYSTATKQKKTSGAVPEEGIYLHHNGSTQIEIKFLAEFEDFDMVVFIIYGRFKGSYILTSERVESH